MPHRTEVQWGGWGSEPAATAAVVVLPLGVVHLVAVLALRLLRRTEVLHVLGDRSGSADAVLAATPTASLDLALLTGALVSRDHHTFVTVDGMPSAPQHLS